MWSVIVLALLGPTPMLTRVMPVTVLPLEMVGGHLRHLRLAGGAARSRRASWLDEVYVLCLCTDLCPPQGNKLVHVALVSESARPRSPYSGGGAPMSNRPVLR